MPLSFRPNCLPTALGPLPHRTARAAWELCLRYLPQVLPLPLLASEGETPAALAAKGFPGVVMTPEHMRIERSKTDARLDDLYLAYLQHQPATRSLSLRALDEWSQREAQIKRAWAVSTALMGPVSLALQLVDDDDTPLIVDDVLVDAITKHVHLRLHWQHTTLRRAAPAVLQWLYEPHLDVVGSPFSPIDWSTAGQLISETFGVNSGVSGVWTTTTIDIPALLEATSVGVVGMRLPTPEQAAQWAPTLTQFIQRGGVLGWGLVPQTVDGLANARVGRLASEFGAVLQALAAAGLPTKDVVRASLIMPQDTLAHLFPNEAEAVLGLTSQLSGMLRHAYDLD